LAPVLRKNKKYENEQALLRSFFLSLEANTETLNFVNPLHYGTKKKKEAKFLLSVFTLSSFFVLFSKKKLVRNKTKKELTVSWSHLGDLSSGFDSSIIKLSTS
jgi:hypothetical protein